MNQTIIRDCRVWDGSGKATFPADLLIDGGRIRAVARNRGQDHPVDRACPHRLGDSLLAPGVANAYSETEGEVVGFEMGTWSPDRLPKSLATQIRDKGLRVEFD
jgi:N-acyl-D-aspartate/D-glutamate deacylase